MDTASILEKSLILRSERKFESAFEHIQGAFHAGHSELKALVWQHNPIFWKHISAGLCTLTRRCGEDAEFLSEMWKDEDFVYSFHRHSAPLPKRHSELQRILNQEMCSLVSESHAIHWIVRDSQARPWGLLSLCDISLVHRRAEVLMGILPGAPTGLTAAAMLILFQFYFNVMKFNKLVSIIYLENSHSINSTMHLGFKKEGIFKRHAYDPRTGYFLDMVQFGLLKEDAFQAGNQRLMKRLLKPGKNESSY
jgi:RimJ/RimL family protein N-acetyltransferase